MALVTVGWRTRKCKSTGAAWALMGMDMVRSMIAEMKPERRMVDMIDQG